MTDFLIIGENIHCTRIIPAKSRRIVTGADGRPAIAYQTAAGEARSLPVSDAIMAGQDYREGRVKHVKLAIQAAMGGDSALAAEGLAYLRHLAERQAQAGAAFLDLNVDEISVKPAEQKAAISWLVRTIGAMSPLPLAIDSSNVEVIRAGLAAVDPAGPPPLLNSASLERLEALDLAREHRAAVVVTAAGERGMPADAGQRVANASRMIEAATGKGFAPGQIHVDPLIFPIAVDKDYGRHALDAIAALRAAGGPALHITGGMSNVSFGIPGRKLINDVFLALAIEAGADSGIVDPVASRIDQVLAMDRGSKGWRMAEDVLQGRDEHCRAYLRAWRRGELKGEA
jgi:5-methyltetrahydrofolate--homocysteine methyltransferase